MRKLPLLPIFLTGTVVFAVVTVTASVILSRATPGSTIDWTAMLPRLFALEPTSWILIGLMVTSVLAALLQKPGSPLGYILSFACVAFGIGSALVIWIPAELEFARNAEAAVAQGLPVDALRIPLLTPAWLAALTQLVAGFAGSAIASAVLRLRTSRA